MAGSGARQREVGHMDPQGLSNCLWAAARLQDSVPKVLEAVPTIARRMQEIVDIMNMQDLSNNFWAVGERNAVEPEVLALAPMLIGRIQPQIRRLRMDQLSMSLKAARQLGEEMLFAKLQAELDRRQQ